MKPSSSPVSAAADDRPVADEDTLADVRRQPILGPDADTATETAEPLRRNGLPPGGVNATGAADISGMVAEAEVEAEAEAEAEPEAGDVPMPADPGLGRIDDFDDYGNQCFRWRFENESGEHVESVRVNLPNGDKQLSRKPAGMDGPWQPLYHEHLDLSQPVIVVEGEKTCDAVWETGHQATCWAGGATSFKEIAYTAKWLAEKGAVGLVLVPDNHDVGRKAMAHFKEAALKSRPELTVLTTASDGDDGADAADIPLDKRQAAVEEVLAWFEGVRKKHAAKRYQARLGLDLELVASLTKSIKGMQGYSPKEIIDHHRRDNNKPEFRYVLAKRRIIELLDGNNYEVVAGKLAAAAAQRLAESDGDVLQPLVFNPGSGAFPDRFTGSCYRCRKPGFAIGGWTLGNVWASCKDCGIKTKDVKADLMPPDAAEEDEEEVVSAATDGTSSHFQFASVFIAQANGDWLFDDDDKQWWHWYPHRRVWREDTHKARRIMAAVIKACTGGDEKEVAKWQQNHHISGALAVASDSVHVSRSKNFDSKPMLAGLPDGMTLDLTTGTARESLRDDQLTMKLAVVPEAGDTDDFDAFLQFAFSEFKDTETLVESILWFLGDSLRGVCCKSDNHGFLFFHGDAGTGKSTITDIMFRLLGSYATTVSAPRIVGKREDHLQWLMRLRGKRMVVAAELPNKPLKCEIVNSISAGDPIEANDMRKGSVDFRPVAHLVMNGNHRPNVDSPGTFRRMRLVEMNRKPEDEDDELEDRIVEDEGAAILHRAIEVRAKVDRPKWPEEMGVAVKAYELENDLVGMWLAERTEPSLGGFTQTAEAYSDFIEWCKANGYRPPSKTFLSKGLAKKGHKVEVLRDGPNKSPKRCYMGIGLLPTDPATKQAGRTCRTGDL